MTRQTKTRVAQAVVFFALMVVLQLAGSVLFPEQWKGATGGGAIILWSAIATIVYAAIMLGTDWAKRSRERAERE